MANWARKKVFRLAKGFKGRSKNCFGVALRKVHRATQYAYRDRKVKKRTMRRTWIGQINAATREHGITYSQFANAVGKNSNVQLDRKILSSLCIQEPYSFKAVLDEVKVQAGLETIMRRKPMVTEMQGVSFNNALHKGLMVDSKASNDVRAILEEPKARLYGLRFPEKDANTERDYMRLSFMEEDQEFMEKQEQRTLTVKEQKRLPREVLTDNWDEDMSLYKNKRKP